MSDTVRFLTFNDTVTPANSSGANGFPFPFATGPTGTGTANPVKVPFTDAIKYWWRVNGWTLTSTWSVTFGGNTYVFPTGPLTPNIPGSELGLISASASHIFGGGIPPPSFTDFRVNPLFISDNPAAQASDVWPNFNGGTVTALLGESGGNVEFAFDTSRLAAVTGSFVGQIDGHNVDIYYDATSVPPTSFSVGTMIFTPSSFWPYASFAAATPVYDTSTGAQLQSPTL